MHLVLGRTPAPDALAAHVVRWLQEVRGRPGGMGGGKGKVMGFLLAGDVGGVQEGESVGGDAGGGVGVGPQKWGAVGAGRSDGGDASQGLGSVGGGVKGGRCGREREKLGLWCALAYAWPSGETLGGLWYFGIDFFLFAELLFSTTQ